MTILALADASPAAAVAVRSAGGVPVGTDLFHFSDAARALRAADAALEDGMAAGYGIATTEEGESAARGAAQIAAPAGVVATANAAAETGDARGTWIDLGPLLPGGGEALRYLRERPSVVSAAMDPLDARTPVEISHGGGLVAPPDDPTEGPSAFYWLVLLAAVAFLYLWTAPNPPIEFEIIPTP